MSTEAFFRRQMGALRPVDAAGEQALADIPQGELVRVTIRRPRNVLHHRKWFALLNVIFPHQSLYPTQETLLAAIKVALGYGDTVKLPDGRTIIVPGSISFAKMDQTAFTSFYDRAVNLIVTKIIPGVGREDLEREVNEILDGYDSSGGTAGGRATPEGAGGSPGVARNLAGQ